MKLLILPILLFFTLSIRAGEIYNLFEHQNIISNGFSDNKWEENKSKRVKEVFEIGLERKPCQLKCPVYSVIINQKGEFLYIGEQHVKNLGSHSGKVSLQVVKKLRDYVNTINYFSLRNSYSANRSGGTSAFTYVKSGSKQKVISNRHNSAPASIWALELMIDKLINKQLKL